MIHRVEVHDIQKMLEGQKAGLKSTYRDQQESSDKVWWIKKDRTERAVANLGKVYARFEDVEEMLPPWTRKWRTNASLSPRQSLAVADNSKEGAELATDASREATKLVTEASKRDVVGQRSSGQIEGCGTRLETHPRVPHVFKLFRVQRASAMEVNARVHLQSTLILRMASFHQHRIYS